MTNQEKLKVIKGARAELSRSYIDELLIIIAEELIKMNEYFERIEFDKENINDPR